MHVLHLIKTSEGATWAIRLLQELKNKYNDITFCVVIPSGGKHFDEYRHICEHIYDLDFRINNNILKSGRQLQKIVSREKPDIIHSWFTQTTLYSRLFLMNFNVPKIFQVVGPAHLENFIFRTGDIKSAGKHEYWIATSEYIYNKYLKHGVNKDKIFLNYAFIDAQKLLQERKTVDKRDIRKEFNLPENTKIVGTASYIYPPRFYEKAGIKGHEYLLEAFKKLLKKRSDIVLLIAGTTFGGNTEYEKKLKKIAKGISTSNIIFSGQYKHVYEVISNMDVFIYLSKSENLGGVYESLLFEIPTISSNRGALPELVINRETGFNLDPSDTEKVVKAMEHLLDSDNSHLTEKGRDLVLRKFQKGAIAQKTYDIYLEVLKRH